MEALSLSPIGWSENPRNSKKEIRKLVAYVCTSSKLFLSSHKNVDYREECLHCLLSNYCSIASPFTSLFGWCVLQINDCVSGHFIGAPNQYFVFPPPVEGGGKGAHWTLGSQEIGLYGLGRTITIPQLRTGAPLPNSLHFNAYSFKNVLPLTNFISLKFQLKLNFLKYR